MRNWLIAALLITQATVVFAQTPTAGARVEYKIQNNPEKWEVGTAVRELPGGTQWVIREKPTQFFPQGSERAYNLNEIRPVRQQAAAAPAPTPVPAAAPAPARPAASPAPAPAVPAGAGGPMSQQEVLAFLRTRLGDGDPFMNPKREQVLQQLRAEVLRRGVNFRRAVLGQFADDLGKYGALSNVTAPLTENFGTPGTVATLLGKWQMAKVGATTTVTRGSDVYQRQEYAGNTDAITINADGNYVWGAIRGKWRKSTPDEMAKSDKGGEGVVLLKGKSGADWLAFNRDEEGPQGKGVKVVDLETRNLRERGTR